MSAEDFLAFSLCDAAAAIRERKVSSVALTSASLERARTEQPRLNCFIEIHAESALEAANAADRALANGEISGPLHGVPLAHKDLFYRQGRVCTCGAEIRRAHVPARTATVLQRLDAAGALDIGTLNMSEFAAGPTGHNAHFGDCRNPWNEAHIAGGSSSGSAAATAARIVFAALGSDTAGSIRIPAAACGLAGLMPTRGRVSGWGVMPFSWSLDTPGPLTRTARDSARLLGIIAGPDRMDPNTAPAPVPDYEAGLERGIEGLRIGTPANYLLDGISAEQRNALEASLDVFRSLKAEIVEVEIPDLDQATALSHVLLKPEASAIHAEWLRDCPEGYSDTVRRRVDEGFYVSAVHYIDALRLRAVILQEFMDAIFEKVDVLHTPTLLQPLPRLDETDPSDPEIIATLTRTTRPVNYLGLPAVSVPAGFAGDGLPLSFQLVGRPFDEALLLRAAHAYELVTRWVEQAPR